ncbi:MAG: AAA family ATPase [Desulfobacteraceae bacterium]|jgi:type II secretory pathway predicted ATPase ExeA
MIKAFYNLKILPFQKDIKPEDTFLSAPSKELGQRLDYIKQKRGIMMITGMPGTGKTLHLRTFVQKLNPNLYKYFYLPLSTVNTTDFYRQLAMALAGQAPWKKNELFSCIQTAIKDYVSNSKKLPVIIFDEAHLLRHDNFHELQIISNFDMDSTDPALFILAGQPHLRDKLLNPIHQSFNQRITLKFHLTPLSKEETRLYIDHQMAVAGKREPIFDKSATEAIYKNSAGTPRIINSLATKCLTLGALEKKERLTHEEVYCAAREM